jgi:high-affinity iron transporter
MFAAAIIVFREVLEAAILIGIIAAATRSVPGRTPWLIGGIVAGSLGAALIAVFAKQIATAGGGLGHELFNAAVLGAAVVMLAWHNLWMASHGAALAADARGVSNQIREGRRECSVLLVFVGLAVLREGAETVLFLSGVATSGNAGAGSMLTGGTAGLIAGTLAGYALYAGLVRIPLRQIFSATSLLVLLIAAGLASQAARYLLQADLVPTMGYPLWDTSTVIPQASALGVLLHDFIGYDAEPAGVQLAFYLVVLVTLGGAMWFVSHSSSTRRATAR